MKINDLIKSSGVKPTGAASARTATAVEKRPYAESLPQDSAELSSKLQQESRILDAARLVYDALPDVRADKVKLAKERLADGFYNRPEIQDKIVEHLAIDAEARPVLPLSANHKDLIAKRIADGYYDKPEIQEQIARGMAEDAEG